MMQDVTFANPEYFWLLLLLPLMGVYQWRIRRRRQNLLRLPDTQTMEGISPTFRQRMSWFPLLLRYITIVAVIFALARPRSSSSGTNVTSEGISIVLAMDISSSMLAEDLKPNRIEAAKKVAAEFIESRPNDLIGLVIFSGESFTQCPITSDHSVLLNLLKDVHSGMLKDRTALGEGLATAIARIKDSPAKSKVVILLTDGVSNTGAIAPVTAGEIARTFGIRVYTIGVGRNGTAPYPVRTSMGIIYENIPVEIDEPVMQQISNSTDGKYFRATNNKKLKEIYAEIDKMEKTKVEVTEFRRYTERYLPFALIAVISFITELFLSFTWLRRLP